MGVPLLFKCIKRLFKDVVSEETISNSCYNSSFEGLYCNNVYLDMNSLIHQCLRDDMVSPESEADFISRIYSYIDYVISMTNPSHLIYLAVDGPAPMAKIKQQRLRRFKLMESPDPISKEIEMSEPELEDGEILAPSYEEYKFDRNMITPGTPFMSRLAAALKIYAQTRLASGRFDPGLSIVVSDSSIPGEGEHKIMDFTRAQRFNYGQSSSRSHVFVGADADLMLLALSMHEEEVFVVREAIFEQVCDICWRRQVDCVLAPDFCLRERRRNRRDFTLPKLIMVDVGLWRSAMFDSFLHASNFVLQNDTAVLFHRASLEMDGDLLKKLNPPLYEQLNSRSQMKFSQGRIINDVISICALLGNDFVPHVPPFSLKDGGLELLLTTYPRLVFSDSIGGNLINEDGAIHFEHMKTFLSILASSFRVSPQVKRQLVLESIRRRFVKDSVAKSRVVKVEPDIKNKFSIDTEDYHRRINNRSLFQEDLVKNEQNTFTIHSTSLRSGQNGFEVLSEAVGVASESEYKTEDEYWSNEWMRAGFDPPRPSRFVIEANDTAMNNNLNSNANPSFESIIISHANQVNDECNLQAEDYNSKGGTHGIFSKSNKDDDDFDGMIAHQFLSDRNLVELRRHAAMSDKMASKSHATEMQDEEDTGTSIPKIRLNRSALLKRFLSKDLLVSKDDERETDIFPDLIKHSGIEEPIQEALNSLKFEDLMKKIRDKKWKQTALVMAKRASSTGRAGCRSLEFYYNALKDLEVERRLECLNIVDDLSDVYRFFYYAKKDEIMSNDELLQVLPQTFKTEDFFDSNLFKRKKNENDTVTFKDSFQHKRFRFRNKQQRIQAQEHYKRIVERDGIFAPGVVLPDRKVKTPEHSLLQMKCAMTPERVQRVNQVAKNMSVSYWLVFNWATMYYFRGCQHWNIVYNYSAAPLLDDLINFTEEEFTAVKKASERMANGDMPQSPDENEPLHETYLRLVCKTQWNRKGEILKKDPGPINPLAQLLSVLPAKSLWNALPASLCNMIGLVDEEDVGKFDFDMKDGFFDKKLFTNTWKVDTCGRDIEWLWMPKLPILSSQESNLLLFAWESKLFENNDIDFTNGFNEKSVLTEQAMEEFQKDKLLPIRMISKTRATVFFRHVPFHHPPNWLTDLGADEPKNTQSIQRFLKSNLPDLDSKHPSHTDYYKGNIVASTAEAALFRSQMRCSIIQKLFSICIKQELNEASFPSCHLSLRAKLVTSPSSCPVLPVPLPVAANPSNRTHNNEEVSTCNYDKNQNENNNISHSGPPDMWVPALCPFIDHNFELLKEDLKQTSNIKPVHLFSRPGQSFSELFSQTPERYPVCSTINPPSCTIGLLQLACHISLNDTFDNQSSIAVSAQNSNMEKSTFVVDRLCSPSLPVTSAELDVPLPHESQGRQISAKTLSFKVKWCDENFSSLAPNLKTVKDRQSYSSTSRSTFRKQPQPEIDKFTGLPIIHPIKKLPPSHRRGIAHVVQAARVVSTLLNSQSSQFLKGPRRLENFGQARSVSSCNGDVTGNSNEQLFENGHALIDVEKDAVRLISQLLSPTESSVTCTENLSSLTKDKALVMIKVLEKDLSIKRGQRSSKTKDLNDMRAIKEIQKIKERNQASNGPKIAVREPPVRNNPLPDVTEMDLISTLRLLNTEISTLSRHLRDLNLIYSSRFDSHAADFEISRRQRAESRLGEMLPSLSSLYDDGKSAETTLHISAPREEVGINLESTEDLTNIILKSLEKEKRREITF